MVIGKNKEERNISIMLPTVIDEKAIENDVQAVVDEGQNEKPTVAVTTTTITPPYTILSETEKKFTILIAASVSILSFMSANIYYPALGPLSKALNVPTSKINLTITSYMILQALVPLLTGNLSDQRGRRPILLGALLIFLVANIGLALQTNFAALVTLRCLQSFGGSGATVVSGAAIMDLITRAERGKYMAYTNLGSSIGPALGPVLGGVLTRLLGWRSVFWFLAIYAGVMILVIAGCLRETCRAVVGNGSVPPPRWNQPVWEMLRPRMNILPDKSTVTQFTKRPSFVDSVKIIFHKEIGLLIVVRSLQYCGVMAVLSSLPILLEKKYGFNPLQVGLCYIPFAVGGITARWTVGTIADWNFRRYGHRLGIEIQRNRQSKEQLQKIPLEKVRLEITMPAVYLSCLSMLGYGWVMAHRVHISGPLVMLFILSNTTAGAANTLGALIIDLNAYRPAMAMAGINLARFLLGAGVVAAVIPLIQVVGIGWVGTIVAVVWFVVCSPALWLVYAYGYEWRQHERDVNELL